MAGEFLEAFILVMTAEFGDKTQFLLMALAAKYTVLQMLTGILLGVFINHGAAVIIGCYLANVIRGNLLEIFTGFIFIAFGIMTIVCEDEGNSSRRMLKFGPILTTAFTFLLGEMGDKTQLAAMTLAMEASFPPFVLAGSVTAMVVTGFLGIIIGTSLTKRIPSNIIKAISGLVFIIFGLMRFFN